jgi:hypothetical protein
MNMQKEATYKLNLSGGSLTVKDHVISEELARKILTLVMGGSMPTGGAAEDGAWGHTSHHAAGRSETTHGSAPSPKTFMAQKKPSSEQERITCLAYYLAHHRDMQAFKTRDLTKLNTEAAQPTFSNPAVFARNAVQAEFLSKAGGGSKQITALGEAVVEALPDREKVKVAIESNKSSRKRRGKKARKASR